MREFQYCQFLPNSAHAATIAYLTDRILTLLAKTPEHRITRTEPVGAAGILKMNLTNYASKLRILAKTRLQKSRVEQWVEETCERAGLTNRTQVIWESQSSDEAVRKVSRADWAKCLALDRISSRAAPFANNLTKFRFSDEMDINRFAKPSEKDAILLEKRKMLGPQRGKYSLDILDPRRPTSLGSDIVYAADPSTQLIEPNKREHSR